MKQQALQWPRLRQLGIHTIVQLVEDTRHTDKQRRPQRLHTHVELVEGKQHFRYQRWPSATACNMVSSPRSQRTAVLSVSSHARP